MSERFEIGMEHELRVQEEFFRRGWDVETWGMGTWSPKARRRLIAAKSKIRNAPDMLCTRGADEVAFVDAKQSLSQQTARYTISHACIDYAQAFGALFGHNVYYVFGNLMVLTVSEVRAYAELKSQSNGAYVMVNSFWGRPFDDLFGPPLITLPPPPPPPALVNGERQQAA